MRAHHWDWLHALTFALALIAFGDSEWRVITMARVANWPTVHATVQASRAHAVWIPTARGWSPAERLDATYRFRLSGRDYKGSTVSWYPRTDATALAPGAQLTVHYQQGDPVHNAAFAPPRVTVWIESLAGIALVLVSGLPWHRWKERRNDDEIVDELDTEPPLELDVSADGVMHPDTRSRPTMTTRVGG